VKQQLVDTMGVILHGGKHERRATVLVLQHQPTMYFATFFVPVALISILMNCVLQTGPKATSLEYTTLSNLVFR
jgi:hypothetical protein